MRRSGVRAPSAPPIVSTTYGYPSGSRFFVCGKLAGMFFTVGAEHCHCRALTSIGGVHVAHRRLDGLMTHQFLDANHIPFCSAKRVPNVWRLCRARHNRHYAECRTMPSRATFTPYTASL